jgi:hypothetical protein
VNLAKITLSRALGDGIRSGKEPKMANTKKKPAKKSPGRPKSAQTGRKKLTTTKKSVAKRVAKG